MRLRLIPPLFMVGVAAASLLLSVGCEAKAPETPISATPGLPVAPSGSLLHDARLDLAGRLKVSPEAVLLKEVRAVGWDGCLGVAIPGQACAELFVGGYIGFFGVGEKTYRYHFGGARFIATDFVKGTITDGSPVPPELMPDFPRLLAQYARYDWALVVKVDATKVAVSLLEPRVFSNTCLNFEVPGASCGDARTNGVIVGLAAAGQQPYYHCGETGGCARLDPTRGTVTTLPSMNVGAIETEMRQDVAKRLGVSIDEISIATYRRVTWPDGCLGVYPPGVVCSQALVEGFLAILTDASNKEYRYHGSGARFIAASFEQGAKISEPLVPR